MSETWSRETCPHCWHCNWFCLGNLNDQTSSTGEEVVASCWQCRRRWYRVPADDSNLDVVEGKQALPAGRDRS